LEGQIDIATNIPCPDFEAALEEHREEMFAAAEEGIANSVEGLDTLNVTVYDKRCIAVAGRLLHEIESIARRLSQSTIKVFYVIHVDNQVAQQANINAQTVTAELQTSAATQITQVFASDAIVDLLNFTLVVDLVVVEVPEQEVVEEEYVPTVTSTTTSLYSESIKPLEDGEEGAAAAMTGIIVVILIMTVCFVSVCARFFMSRKKGKPPPKFNITDIDFKDVFPEAMHIVWHLEDIPDAEEPHGAAPPAASPSEISEELPTPVLPDGSPVEYYSRTHNLWLPGTLQVAITAGTLFNEPEVSYHITINTGGSKRQLRENVMLDCFRAPLAEGEPVEVHSATANKWIPATVEGFQKSPTLYGYRLILDAEAGEGFAGRRLDRVAAVRVRRRFDEGTLVARYMGPVEGFETGFLDEAAMEDPGPELDFGPGLTGPMPSVASVYSHISNMPPPAAPAGAVQAWDRGFDGVNGKPDRSQEGEICQWSWVRYSSIDCETNSMVVPSYLLSPMAEI